MQIIIGEVMEKNINENEGAILCLALCYILVAVYFSCEREGRKGVRWMSEVAEENINEKEI